MAARLEPRNGRAWTPQKVRDRIRTRLLAKRLEDHGLGNVKMEKSQVMAIVALLKKTLPDLQAIQLSGNPDSPVHISVTDSNL